MLKFSAVSQIWKKDIQKLNDWDLPSNWNNSDFVALGITFSADISDIAMINVNTKLDKIWKEILQWSKRNLTSLGKITVVKTLILPKFFPPITLI